MLGEIVQEAARRFGDRAAFVASDGWGLTYAELDRLSDEVAAGLAERGITEGDLIALALPSTPEYIVSYVAAAKLGAITAGINPRYTGPERAGVLAVARPDLVLATPELATLDVDGALDEPAPPTVVIERAASVDGLLEPIRLPSTTSTASVTAATSDDERVVAVVFTSGTTGTPKGAVFTNRELTAIARSDVATWDEPEQWGGGGAMLASTQFAHVGFMTKLPWYLRLGTTTYLLDRWRAHDVLDLVATHRMATIGGIAPQIALLLREPDFDDFDLSCVQSLVVGGASSPPALVTEARRRFGAAYSIRYSSTESGGVGTGTAFDADDEEALFTVGRPRGEVEIEIRDPDDGIPVASGEVGELCLLSPCQMRGYWKDPVATAEALHDGWLHTGDLASIDERGCVRLAGRAKEMFIRGGYNVYPVEVESVLVSHPGVADVAVVPRPDDVMGEIGVAVVVAHDPEQPPSLDDLRNFARDRLAAYKLPEAVRLVASLPLTAMHKLDRRALAEAERHR